MDPTTRTLIEALHRASMKYVLALTGGGTTAAAQLLSVPGGSRTILEVVVPYHERSLAEFLGAAPEQYCSAETARRIAARARERAAWLTPTEPVLGVGVTATLATDRPKRGDHRFHIAARGSRRAMTYSLTLNKGGRNREDEEAVLSAVLLNVLAENLGAIERVPVPLLPRERMEIESSCVDRLSALLHGEIRTVCLDVDGRLQTATAPPAALLPGSFNPLHEGHRRLAEVAGRLLGVPLAFELSVINADKPPLSRQEIDQRRRQFQWQAPLWLTHAPTFADKAELFPGTTFVVGVDTAVRIVAPRFYGDSEERMNAALERTRALGCHFLVAGRVDGAGRFTACEEMSLPEAFGDLFQGIPAEAFRHDISSTQLRM